MKNKLYLIWILLVGVCGGVLRGMSLLFGYEAESGLPVAGYLPATILMALTIVVVLSAALAGKLGFAKRSSWSFEQMYCGMPGGVRVICAFFGICTAILCGIGLLRVPEQCVEQATVYGDTILMPGTLIASATAVMWVLGLVSGICMLLLALRQGADKQAVKSTGLFATIPIFWCCLDLIMVYHENSGNPVLSDYSYLLLMIIAIMTAFYSMGSFLYSAKGAAARWVASAGIAVYLAFVNAGGALIWMFWSNTDLSMTQWLGTGGALRIYIAVFVGLYLLLQLTGTMRKSKD